MEYFCKALATAIERQAAAARAALGAALAAQGPARRLHALPGARRHSRRRRARLSRRPAYELAGFWHSGVSDGLCGGWCGCVDG